VIYKERTSTLLPSSITFHDDILLDVPCCSWNQAAQPTGGAWAKYELATGSWPGAAGGSAQPFSEGATRRKFLKEAARDGLASAQVTLALEEHLTGPCRTAPSPKDMKGAWVTVSGC